MFSISKICLLIRFCIENNKATINCNVLLRKQFGDWYFQMNKETKNENEYYRYAQNVIECRRQQQLAYFGERFDRAQVYLKFPKMIFVNVIEIILDCSVIERAITVAIRRVVRVSTFVLPPATSFISSRFSCFVYLKLSFGCSYVVVVSVIVRYCGRGARRRCDM